MEENMEQKNKLTIHQIFWYFIIFSIAGLFIETIYSYITSGTTESRKGLIWGPFCPVYGVSGAILIIALNGYHKKRIGQLFIYGFLVGSIAEYILSFGLESIYGMRFWDYGYIKANLNGRICLQYSLYWGILSVIIMKLIKPLLDKLIEKIPVKPRNIIEIILFVFLVIDCIFTVWGIQTYENRVLYNKVNQKETNHIWTKIQQTIENNYFTNERISHTFPNLRVKDKQGNEIWVHTLIKENKN